MTRKFLDKYFSSAKIGKFRSEIHNFYQKATETNFETWERFKEIVIKCQHRGIELWMQHQDFWDSLTPTSHRILSNATRGPLMNKTLEEIVKILDELSEDANQWPSKSAERRRSTSDHQVDANTSVQVQLDDMAKEIRNLTLATIQSEPHAGGDICRRGHPTHTCQASTEEVNTMGNYNFNKIGQKHLDLSWSSPRGIANAWQQNNLKFQGQGDPDFTNQSRQQFQPQQPNQPSLEDLTKAFIVKTDEIFEVQGESIQNIEKQVGHIATI
ncbi:uncharacterized protein [Nicotiana sylvestris]|uniref:Uncharacterized protein LOC104223042 n=1 Tax=Nicotiana sylvestris TaxID=4096 RepID=A0A1U7VY44_NICSY|nr:PREDICTED: uncharacterized protein LOC104223042 [Nicotiana sylvestris]